MTQSAVVFYSEPTNLDYLLPDIRLQFGDLNLNSVIFSDTIMRTAAISAIRYLQRNWNGKYQVYLEAAKIQPQPANVPAGYIRINSLHGQADIPATTVEGSIFRNPYVVFTADPALLVESPDEQAIILAAVYLLRKAQISSNVGDFLAWGTEDIRYNNLGVERGLSKLLANDLQALQDYLKSRIAQPIRSEFPIGYIPQLTELTHEN